ncbi:MAG: enoyl-CoA hydratase-related protein [Candidatus Tectomicrobia bacterium]|nr:enoyl-CoA hydratase-related protein [Candidatus Tectomicrobia bacterium]
MNYSKIVVDEPRPGVRRVTLNRPEKRNPLSNELRAELFHVLETTDLDDSVRVTIIRGAGPCFSAGYDLNADNELDQPFYTPPGLGVWPRHVVESCCRMWDMGKPIIAQVHGYCLAGATELAAACDLVYVAEDAMIGYPVVRTTTPPDNQFFPWLMGMRRAMELMLTGDHMSGVEAADGGFANRAFPAEELDNAVLDMAERVAKVPSDVQQINKRAVHRQMEVMGIRTGIRAGAEIEALGTFTETCQAYVRSLRQDVNATLSKRDEAFGDYRTRQED